MPSTLEKRRCFKEAIMKRILSLFVVLFFIVSCGGGEGDEEMNLPDFTPVDLPEPDEFVQNFDPSDYGNELADADYMPDEIVSLFVDSFESDFAKAQIIEQLRENVPCGGGFGNDTDEEIWNNLVYEFDLDDIEDWGSSLEEAVRNALANDLPIDLNTTLREIWGFIADEIGAC